MAPEQHLNAGLLHVRAEGLQIGRDPGGASSRSADRAKASALLQDFGGNFARTLRSSCKSNGLLRTKSTPTNDLPDEASQGKPLSSPPVAFGRAL